MAGVQKVLVMGVFAVLLMTTLMPRAADALDCSMAMKNMVPCLAFLQSNGMGYPDSQCCGGVRQLAGMAKTSPAKRQICSCLKSQLNSNLKVTDAAVSKLPGKCKVSLGFQVTKNINCNTL